MTEAGAQWAVEQLPSRDELALAIARKMGGWNDDTSEPELEGKHREMAEAHWERVNATCLEQGGEYADAVLALIREAYEQS